MTTSPVILAFGGRAAAGALIAPLAGRVGAPVVTLTVDLGQGADLEQMRDQALAGGAVRAHVVDARREFARDAILPALRAGALSSGGAAGSQLSWPVVARHLVSVARMERAMLVAHGACEEDRVPFEQLIRALAPDLAVIALADVAAPAADGERHVSTNLWSRTVTLTSDDTWTAPPAALYARTTEPARCAAQPAVVEIAVEGGIPVAVNGVSLDFEELVEVVDTIAGDHGVGRVDRTAGRPGRRRRQIVEAPAAEVLGMAVAELAEDALDAPTLALRRQMAGAYAALISQGLWASPARAALDAFTAASAGALTGIVRLQLTRGACRIVGRRVGVVQIEAAAEAQHPAPLEA
jgi:argininosuccinate synthase